MRHACTYHAFSNVIGQSGERKTGRIELMVTVAVRVKYSTMSWSNLIGQNYRQTMIVLQAISYNTRATL